MRARAALAALAFVTVARAAHAQLDPRGDWRTLATPHFRVHFRRELEPQGRRAAADAERAWTLLASELHTPRGPVDLVVADNVDVTNGFATRFPSNRIVLYIQPPVDVSELRFYDDWLQLGITHELTHIFHLDRSRGVWRLAQGIFGRNPALFPNGYGPSWLTEGLAVYYESRLTGAGRLVGTEHRLIARAAAADAQVPRIDQLSLAGSVFPLGERAYAYGSLLVDFIARAGGPQHVRDFVDRQSAQLIPWRLDHAAQKSFGLSFTEAWRRWRDSVTRSVDAPSSSGDAWREITREGWFVEAPRWLDAHALVVGVTDGRNVAGAERVALDGARTRLGRRNSLSPNVAFPGGGLLFAQLDFVDPFTERSDLYVQTDAASRDPGFGAGSAGQRRLTVGARLTRPDARADGAIVAVQSGGGTTWLARVSPDGRTIVPLTVASPDTQWTEPRWSPAGNRIVAVQLVRGGRSAIVVLDTLGAARCDVVRDRAVNATPSWSPDGRRVYWSSDRTGAPQLYVADVTDGTRDAGATRLSGVTTGLVEPAPSPGGGVLAALLYRVDGYHVAVADSATLSRTAAASDVAYYEQTSRISDVVRATGSTTSYSPWRSLWPRYWTPVAGTSHGGSITVGGATSGNDVLGRHAYALQATWNTLNGDLEGDASYRYARFAQPLVDLGASQAWQYDTVGVRFTNGTTGKLPLYRRARTGSAALTFRRPRVRTGSALSIGASYESREYTSTSSGLVTRAEDVIGTRFPAVFVSGSWLDTRRPIRSISPEDGVALSANAQQRWQNGALGPQSRRAIGALRVYKSLDLPGFAHHVLALRVAGGVADDKAATELAAGGTSGSSEELLPGLVVGTSPRTFGVRGFPASAQQGLRAAAGSLEYRAPLALPARGARLLPVFADRLSFTAFTDAASAWCPSGIDRGAQLLCLDDTSRTPTSPRWLASVGGEIGLDAALAYDAPYRFRLGVAAPVAQRALAPNSVSVYFTLGLAF